MKWAMWNDKNIQRILNAETGMFFQWGVGESKIVFASVLVTPNPLFAQFESPEIAASEWERIKETVFRE